MVLSACCITLFKPHLMSSYLMESYGLEKASWINWTIKISYSMHWVLLAWFLSLRSCFQANHHATYCEWWSLTSHWPIEHTCFHFGARVCSSHMQRESHVVDPSLQQGPAGYADKLWECLFYWAIISGWQSTKPIQFQSAGHFPSFQQQ